jgi:hypothetical protein
VRHPWRVVYDEKKEGLGYEGKRVCMSREKSEMKRE